MKKLLVRVAGWIEIPSNVTKTMDITTRNALTMGKKRKIHTRE
jgi:hypothetical protein